MFSEPAHPAASSVVPPLFAVGTPDCSGDNDRYLANRESPLRHSSSSYMALAVQLLPQRPWPVAWTRNCWKVVDVESL